MPLDEEGKCAAVNMGACGGGLDAGVCGGCGGGCGGG